MTIDAQVFLLSGHVWNEMGHIKTPVNIKQACIRSFPSLVFLIKYPLIKQIELDIFSS